MNKFLITEDEKSRILEMHQNATSRQYLNEAPTTPYDPWNAGGKGLKFKSKADYDNFFALISVSFTPEDGPNFPHIMTKNNMGTYSLKTYETTIGKTNAVPTIQNMGLSLFYIAAASGFKSLDYFKTITNVQPRYQSVFTFLNQIAGVTSGVESPIGLVDSITNSTNKVFLDVKQDWANIISLKLAPIYKSRIDTYASIPAQPK